LKRLSKIISVSLLFLFAVILTVFSERACELARDGLRICALSVIPSLFPYMVVSQLIIGGGACDFIGRLLPVSRLYGLPKSAGTPIILGALCGFPVGAKTACEMYRNGSVSKVEAEVLISAANNTGPSFVVSVIGASFFGSTLFGWQLYLFQLVSSVIAAVAVNRIFFPFKSADSKGAVCKPKKISIYRSVADSTVSVLTVCGFIVFFTVVSGFCLTYIKDLSQPLAGLFSSLLEFCTGAGFASSIGGKQGQLLCGLAVGWSGISVFCQTAAFSAPLGLSLKRCICTKALQGLILGILAMLPTLDTASRGSYPVIYEEASLLLSSPLPVALISGLLYFFVLKRVTNT